MRVGIIGFGYIGRHASAAILAGKLPGVELAFVHARRFEQLGALPRHLAAKHLDAWRDFGAELIVECAHPDISHQYGALFLQQADYLPLSVNALARASTEQALLSAANASGHRLLIPHGALIGLDNLVEVRDNWQEATITFRKHPDNIDFADSGIARATIDGVTTLYDGPVRGIAGRFPRNVNTMTTFGLATVGLDRCRAVLIADPTLNVAIAEVRAVGKDGSLHESRKVQPVVGVSGTEMLAAQLASIARAAGVQTQGISFV